MASIMMPTSQELLDELGVVTPPTEDELPYSDGMPMESKRHILQMNLLIETLESHWKERDKGFVGGNMFIYFNLKQLKNVDFRGPDFFAVLDAEKRERKSWVCWQEGMGPDVVIELLSNSTAKVDKIEKKKVYEQQLRVPEYFWFHPFSGELAGFELAQGKYKAIRPDKQGRLRSKKLGLWLVQRPGLFNGVEANWLRWMQEDGTVLPTGAELAEAAEFRAAQEKSERQEAERQALDAAMKAILAEQETLAERAEKEAAQQAALQAEQTALLERTQKEAALQAALQAEQTALLERTQKEAAQQAALQAEQAALLERTQKEAAQQTALELAERLRLMEEELRRLKA